MALYIVLNDERELTWHTGQNSIAPKNVLNTEFIRADGDELEYIVSHFKRRTYYEGRTFTNECTIPVPNSRIAVWYGDIARTILANL